MGLVHYTIGGPYFNEWRDCEYSEEWRRDRDAMLQCMQRSGATTEAAKPKLVSAA